MIRRERCTPLGTKERIKECGRFFLYPLLIRKIVPLLVIAGQSFSFIVKYVKNGKELCDRQKILNFLRQFQEFQRAALFLNGCKARNQLADTARIDIADAAQIEQNLVFAFAEQAADRCPKGDTA